MGYTTEELNRRLSLDSAYVNVVVGLLCCTGVLGNLSVIVIYRFQIRRQLGNRKLLPYLAAVDLVTCIFGTVYIIVHNTHHADFTSNGLCKSLTVITYSCLLASSFMIVFIAIQRYLKVCRPLVLQYTKNIVSRAPIVVIILGVLLSAPLGLFSGKLQYYHSYYNVTGYKCDVSYTGPKSYFVAYLTFLILLFVITTVVLTLLNSFIAKTILRQRREMRSYRRRDKSSRKGKGVCFSSVMMIEYSDLETKSESLHNSRVCASDNAVGEKLRESCKAILDKYSEQAEYLAQSSKTELQGDVNTEVGNMEANDKATGKVSQNDFAKSHEHVCSKSVESKLTDKDTRRNEGIDEAVNDHVEDTQMFTNKNGEDSTATDSLGVSDNCETESRFDIDRSVEKSEENNTLKNRETSENGTYHSGVENIEQPANDDSINDANVDPGNTDEIQNSPTIVSNGLSVEIAGHTARASTESIKSEVADDINCLATLRRRRARITTRDISKGDYDPEGTRYSIMLMVISVTFVLTWLPVIVVEIIEATNERQIETFSPPTFAALRLCESMIIVKSVANPYIYAMFDSEFRARLLQILLCVRLRAFLNKHHVIF